MNILEARVFTAYYRSPSTKYYAKDLEECFIKGFRYFVLRDIEGMILAVYRYIEKRDTLKRMRRIPKELLKKTKLSENG